MRKLLIISCICFLIVQFSLATTSIKNVFVTGGELKLGNRTVLINNFCISTFEISNAQYARFLNSKKISEDGIDSGVLIINILSPDLQLEFKKNCWKSMKGKENYPMVMVNYFGAQAYCHWVGGKLPTESQWIFAAKGGNKTKNDNFAGGNVLNRVGWFKTNSKGHSHQVGMKKCNELGIYDMSGNAWEWCLNDSLKANSDFCVHKGGSWYAGEQPARIDAHYGNVPTHFSNSVGFRVVFIPKLK